nr:ribosomal protein S14 [Ceratophyllum submersum]CAJ0557035.1 ribosomal protein S14 [Ceratophyllum submersum]
MFNACLLPGATRSSW